jgi:hypothetical protein
MPGQIYDWSCSACALEWVKRSCGLTLPYDIYVAREETVYEIGFPTNINPTYGLMDGSGVELQNVLLDLYGQNTGQAWLGFDDAYEVARKTTGMLSGATYYHWASIRGVQGDTIWIANSAPGYMSVWNNLTRDDWKRLGAWSVVWLV